MIIGIDASRANRNRKTGTEWYAYHLIRQLARLDSQNEYILYSDEPLYNGLVDLRSEIPEVNPTVEFDRFGYQILRSPYNNFKGKVLSWPIKSFWTLGRMSLEMLLKKPDVLFVPAHTLPLIYPKKSVVTIHDIGFKREAGLYQDQPKSKTWRDMIVRGLTRGKYSASDLDYLDWSTLFALKKAKSIITISDFTKKEIELIYGSEMIEKIFVVHNGYDEKLYQKVSEAAARPVLKKYGVDGKYIFYIGRLEKKKNVARLIEGFAVLRHEHPEIKHKLVLAGSAGVGYKEIRDYIAYYNLTSEVIMTGWVEEADMPALYSSAEAFVFPSNYEGFGIPLLEAMASEVPIVASQAASIPEVAADAAVYFNPRNSAEIAEKLADVILSEDLRKTLISNGLARVKQFSWERCARETLAILEMNK